MRFKRFTHSVARLYVREAGQILALTAVLIVAIMGFTAMAVDLGAYLRNLRDAQNDIDAAVLAGAQELLNDPSDTAAAVDKVEEWAIRNGVDPAGELDCCTFTDSNDDGDMDTISGKIDRSSGTFFARVLGFTSFPVERAATARVVHAEGGPVCPWALLGDPTDTDPDDGDYFGIVPGQVYALKVAVGLQDTGNFRALDLGEQGAAGYVDLIAAGCKAEDVGVWKEGDDILTDTEPGNMGNPTRKALNDYYAYEGDHAWCDVDFELDPDDPTMGYIVGDYNPYLQDVREGCERHPLTKGMARIALIPIIDHLPQGSSEPVEILGIASLYIVYWDRTGPPSDTQVYGVFLDEADVSPQYLAGVSDNPLAPLRIMLVR